MRLSATFALKSPGVTAGGIEGVARLREGVFP
jgi:hypothetical protein